MNDLDIAIMSHSVDSCEASFIMGQNAMIDFDNLKLILNVVESKGIFLVGFFTPSRPIPMVILMFQLLTAGLEKAFKCILMSCDRFNVNKHKLHNLRELFECLPDKLHVIKNSGDREEFNIKPCFSDLMMGKNTNNILDLDYTLLRYQTGKKSFDVEIEIQLFEKIHKETLRIIWLVIGNLRHSMNDSLDEQAGLILSKDCKPIKATANGCGGDPFTGLKNVTSVRVSN